MNSYLIKINGKFLKEFVDTDIPQNFRGEWHNHTKQSCSKFILCTSKEDAKIVEGNINLKSNLDLISGILRDGYFEINKFEVIKND